VEQWSNTRPPVAEVEAIRRVGLFARETGCRLYIPHLSSKRALEAAVAEREAGGKIVVETCPQYLFAGEIQGAGKLAKVNPPVRAAEDAEALWPALASGVIQTVGTDHAALMRADKMQEDVIKARPGFPGIGTLLPALLDGVNRGLLAPRDIARSQENAAEIFRLQRKGTIGVGYDADLAVVDVSLKRTVSADDLQSISDFSPYEGLTFTGWPVMTIRRGEVIAENREIRADEGSGRYVRRPQEAKRRQHAAAQ
jgi:dihydroorotase-like cyclic amidohydrolase